MKYPENITNLLDAWYIKELEKVLATEGELQERRDPQ